tara:strand:- start:775 stop:996 length:222 start_codon:yes stop_codon:yes gene_type:complete
MKENPSLPMVNWTIGMGLSGIFKQHRIEGLRPSILPSFIYTGEQGRRPQAVVYIKRGTRPQAAGKILFAYLVE